MAVLVLAAPLSQAQLTDARIQLETFYPSFTSQTSTRPITTVSETEVEFADVAQYEVDSPGGFRLVNTDIDFSGKSITISFRGDTSYSSFANTTINTYVFTDVGDEIPPPRRSTPQRLHRPVPTRKITRSLQVRSDSLFKCPSTSPLIL